MKAVLIAGVAGLVSAVCVGADITWKGEGTTTAWSDGSNWEGGVAPGSGDTAVIPSGKTAGMASADITYVSATETKLAGISLPAADATLWVTNASTVHMKVPVSGVGHYLVDNQAKDFYIFTSNPDFTGPFTISNSTVWVDFYSGLLIDKPFGHGNTVTVYHDRDDMAIRFFIKAGNLLSFDNKWVVYSTKTPKPTACSLYCQVTFNNSFEVHGPFSLNCQGNKAYFKGGFSHTGAGAYTTYSTGSGGPYFQSASCESATTENYGIGGISVNQGQAHFCAPLTESSQRIISGTSEIGKGLIVDCDNLIPYPAKTSLQFGNGNDTAVGRLDLNGHDLACADIFKNGNVTKAGQLFVTSALPAKLTMCGLADWYRYGINNTQMPLAIDGQASFEINSTNRASAGAIYFTAVTSTTSGSLYSRCGTLDLASTTKWPNLSSIEVSGPKARLNLSTADINPGFRLIVSNVTDKAVAINTDIKAKSMYADKWLEKGVYGGPDAGLDADHTLPQLAGTGKVEVEKWGGKPGLLLLFK